MKKIVKIKESELVNLIDKIITESTKGVKTKNTVSKPKPVVNEENQTKTYSVYELSFGQPSRFFNKETKSFTTDVNKATLYSKQDAEDIKKKLLQPRMDKYQKDGKNYTELHIGDLFKKGILK